MGKHKDPKALGWTPDPNDWYEKEIYEMGAHISRDGFIVLGPKNPHTPLRNLIKNLRRQLKAWCNY